MQYVKRIDLWERYLRAMGASLSVRVAALTLGIDKDTAFRWRHRILAAARAVPPFELNGEIRIEATWFPYLEKAHSASAPTGLEHTGSRTLRSRLDPTPCPDDASGRVWVALAEDTGRHRLAELAGPTRPTSDHYVSILSNRIGAVARLIGGRGPYSPLGIAARKLSVHYERGRHPIPAARGDTDERTPGPASGETLAVRLRRWLRPFRGVSSRHLDRYMLWFNALEVGWRAVVPQPWVIGVR